MTSKILSRYRCSARLWSGQFDHPSWAFAANKSRAETRQLRLANSPVPPQELAPWEQEDDGKVVAVQPKRDGVVGRTQVRAIACCLSPPPINPGQKQDN